MTEPCHITNCMRALGHAGAHTSCPSAATLDWDHNRSPIQREDLTAAASLMALDFPTPHWADLND